MSPTIAAMRSRSSPLGPDRMLLPILITTRRTRGSKAFLRAIWSAMVDLCRRRIGRRCLARVAHPARQLAYDLGDAGAGGGGHAPELDATLVEAAAQIVESGRIGGVDLVGSDQLRLGGDGRIKQRQLAVDDVEVSE